MDTPEVVMQTTVVPAMNVHFDTSQTRRQIEEGRDLIGSRQLAAAASVLWSAFDSAVRLSLAELGEQTDRPIWLSDTPRGLASQAVAYGVIDPEDRDVLLRFLQECDEIAEGKAETVDINLLQRVEWFTERTLDEMG